MGHIAHLRNQVQINIYDYIISLIRRKYLLFPLWELNGYCSSIVQTWIPIAQGCFVPSLDDIGPVILEEISKFRHVFSLFRNISLLKWTWLSIWTNLNPHPPSMHCAKFRSLHPKMFYAKFTWNWPSGSGEEDF